MDACYDVTISQLLEAYTKFQTKEPNTYDQIIAAVTDGMTIARNVYYGDEFRACMLGLSGQLIDTCC